MYMGTSRLPRRLAIVGVVITFVLMAMWWCIVTYNLFPPRQVTPNYWEAPPVYWYIRGMIFVLCPGELLGIICMDCPGYAMPLFIWTVAAAINGVLYYWLGRGIVALMRRVRRRAH